MVKNIIGTVAISIAFLTYWGEKNHTKTLKTICYWVSALKVKIYPFDGNKLPQYNEHTNYYVEKS